MKMPRVQARGAKELRSLQTNSTTCRHHSWTADTDAAVERVVVRLPPTTETAQIANKKFAVGAAVDRPPEEDEAGTTLFIQLPVFGDDIGALEQVVENVRIKDWMLCDFVTEHGAEDGIGLLNPRHVEVNLLSVNVKTAFATLELGDAGTPVLDHLGSVERKLRGQ